jgi:hypothetical protein
VGFRVGTFAVTLPSGSFTQNQQGGFDFAGNLDGSALDVAIRLQGDGILEIRVDGRDADLSGGVNPLIVHLTMGGDGGSMHVIADMR